MDRAAVENCVADIYSWIRRSEEWVDAQGINLYAGTNIQSAAVRRAMATTLNSRPSLGEPGDKYETGLEFSDRIEMLATDTVKELFHAKFVEHRVLSGSLANLYAFMATTEPGDDVFAEPAEAAGHATHHQEGAAGLYRLRVHPIPHLPGTHRIDWEALRTNALRVRPRLLLLGSSLPLVPYDLGAAREIADTVGAYLMYDAAHVAGIVAGGRFQQPLAEGADLMTTSTYKTFGGPAGGLVLTNNAEIAGRLKAIAYPGLTANFDMSRVAGLAVAALELHLFSAQYAAQCLANAARLADSLAERGLPVWRPYEGSEFTESHLLAIDAARWGGGTAAARSSEPSNVFFSGIPLPLPAVNGDFSGIRIGVQEITRIGMREEHMPTVADFVARSLAHPEDADAVREEVIDFRGAFRKVVYGLGDP